MSSSTTRRQTLTTVAPVLNYHSYNANGLDEVTIKAMVPNWENSDLVFIQETKLDPSKEARVRDLVRPFGFDCIFHHPKQNLPNLKWYDYGVCVFFKNVQVIHVDLKQAYPDITSPLNPERLIMVEVLSLLTKEKIYFLNLYFPACNSSRLGRAAERQEWATTVDLLSEKLKNEFVVWVGDFNMQKLKINHKPDDRSRMFDQIQEIFEKHGFLNVSDKLWPEKVFTRFSPHPCAKDGVCKSTLDYIVISKAMQQFNQTAIPLYDAKLFVSDHIDIMCSNRVASYQHQAITNATQIVCVVPDMLSTDNKCPYPGCTSKTRKWANNALIVHIRTHTGERPFICPKNCGYRCVSNGSLVEHQETCLYTGPLELLKCNFGECAFNTYVTTLLQPHVNVCQTKLMSGKFKCGKCRVATDDASNFRRHLRSPKHADINNLTGYVCLPCNFATAILTHFNDHLMTGKHMDRLSYD